MLTGLISIGRRAEALGKERTHCEWEHFKDQTFCRGLRRQPDSLLLSAQRGAPGSSVGGGEVQTERQTVPVQYSPSVLSSGSYVSELRHVPPRLKGIWNQEGSRLGWHREGVDQAFVWVVVMKKAEEGREESGRPHGIEKGGWGNRGQRYTCDNSGVAGCIWECFNETPIKTQAHWALLDWSRVDFLHVHA